MKKIKNLAINIGLSVATFFLLLVMTEIGLRFYGGARFAVAKTLVQFDAWRYIAATMLSPEHAPPPPPNRNYSTDVCDYGHRLGIYRTLYRVSDNERLGVEMRPDKDSEVNNQGLRGTEEYPLEKPEGGFRIAVLGDSVTFGWGVDAGSSYPKILERQLRDAGYRNVEVLNFGVPAYNGDQKITMLKERALRYHPDLAIFGWLIDDVGEPILINHRASFLPNFVANFLSQRSVAFGCFYDLVHKSGAPDFKKLYNQASREKSGKMFDEIAAISREKHIPALMVILPVWQTFDKNNAEGIASINEFLNKAAGESGLPSIDILPDIKNLDPTRYQYTINPSDRWHVNIQGGKIIASAIFDAIVKQKELWLRPRTAQLRK